MRRFLHLTIIAASLLLMPVMSHAQDWKTMEYDENGIPLGIRSGEADEKTDDATKPHPIEPGEVLVIDPKDEDIRKILDRGFTVGSRFRLGALGIVMVQFNTPDDMTEVDAVTYLRRNFPDLVVDTNDLMDLSGKDRPQVAQIQDFSRSLSGWGAVSETCGTGIRMGQIDGVVDTRHPALQGRKLTFASFLKKDRIPTAEDHGTAMAVLLIGRQVGDMPAGLLPGAHLYAANIFEIREGRQSGNLAAFVRAIDWLVKNKVQVANLSIAGVDNQIMRLAVALSSNHGLLLVAAAGNNGPGADPAWPAADDGTLAVTAIDRTMHRYHFANRGNYIDFAAPGVDIPTQTPHGVKVQSGTSFAVPFVTAMVALHLQAGFEADLDLIRRSLMRYTTDLGTAGKDPNFGWGLVRLRPSC